SSREQSPYAEMMAGIRVVIAENIERIYNENCQNLGVLTSTDFSLIDRIRRGEEIELSAFTADVDPITREIIEYGGLFEYNVARLQGKVQLPPVHSQEAVGGRAPDLGDPAAVRDARGSGEDDPGSATFSAENAAAQLDATSRPPGDAVANRPRHDASAHDGALARPMTIAEKIFASHWVVDAARGR